MEHFLSHFSSTLSPGGLAITLRNLVLGVALLITFALPAVFVLYSRRIAGAARLAWFIVTLFLSWPAYTVFLFSTRHCKADRANATDATDATDTERTQAQWG